MKIGTLTQSPLRTADPDETIGDAADRMTFFEIGSLAVFEEGKLVGIITERDIVRAIAGGASANVDTVGQFMTRGPVEVTPDDTVDQAIAYMVFLGARHLPVVEKGEVVGMVSARDLLAATLGSDDLIVEPAL